MQGKELVLAALRNEELPRSAWVPFVGCHGGHLIGVPADEYLNSVDLIVKGVLQAVRRYRPDGIPVVFDLQVEAEALGCDLRWAQDNPPSVSSHPLQANKEALSGLQVPDPSSGRYSLVLEATSRLRDEVGEQVALYGLVTGPFTLASHLRGTDLFMDMFDDPEYLRELLAFASEVAQQTAKRYIEAGADVIALVDPMTSQISPEHFAGFVREPATAVFDLVRELGVSSSFFVCGDATRNLEEMCKCRPMNLSIDENIPLEQVKEICARYQISFGGNIPLTTVMLFGTPYDNMRAALDCMEVGGLRGYILAPGCDIPYAVPPENIEAIAAVVHNEVDLAELAQVLEEETEGMEVAVPQYPEGEVVVDVFTLDSGACAPCQYMVAAVREAVKGLGDKVRWEEHKIKTKEAVALMKALSVQKIPTICMNGEVVFESRIPAAGDIRKAIEERLSTED